MLNDRPITSPEPAPAAAEDKAPPPPPPQDPRAARWMALGVRLFILALAAGVVVFLAREWDWFVSDAAEQRTNDAYLQADLTPLAAHVPGYVRAIRVQDFQRVKAGDPLVEIVDDDYRAQLAQAEANVAAAQSAIAVIEQQKILQNALIAQAAASVAASEADLVRYRLERVRQQSLLATGITGTRQVVEQAVDNESHAIATLALSRAQLDQQQQQVNVLDGQLQQAHAALESQKAVRDLAAINLGYTRIAAPVDGMVGQRLAQAGQYLSVGTQVISLVPLPHVWVLANYKDARRFAASGRRRCAQGNPSLLVEPRCAQARYRDGDQPHVGLLPR